MLSFLEFLEERKVDPVELANRAARRYGKKEKYGKWFSAEKGKHIPLKSFSAKTSNEVERKSEKVYNKLGGSEKYHAAHKSTTMKISDLNPTQPFVRTDNQEKLKTKVDEKSPSHIIVATHKGKHYIMDGHHAVAAAAFRGDTHVPVKHLDMDKY